jgi:hypothetical protein
MYPYADQPEYLCSAGCAVSVCGKLNPSYGWQSLCLCRCIAWFHNLPFRFYVVLWVHCHGISLHVVRRRDMCLPVTTSHGWQYNLPGNFHVRNASEHIHPGTKDSYRQDSHKLPPCSMICRLPSQVQPVSNIESYTTAGAPTYHQL